MSGAKAEEKRGDFVAPPEGDPRDLRFVPADPALAKTLTAEQVEAYNRDGFVSGIPIFSDEEAVQVRGYIDGLIESVITANDGRNPYSINAYHAACAGMYDLCVEERILDAVQDLIGEAIVCWGNHLFAKMPGDPMDVPFHQDANYWPWSPTRTVTVWLAIDDVDEENAAMEFVPGSHLQGGLAHVEKPLDGSRVLGREVADADRWRDRFVNALRAGSISLHSDLLLHGSPRNASSRRRAGLTIRYAAAEVKAAPGYEYWSKVAIRARGVDESNGAHWGNWRRPDGERPDRMAEFKGGFDGTPLPDAS